MSTQRAGDGDLRRTNGCIDILPLIADQSDQQFPSKKIKPTAAIDGILTKTIDRRFQTMRGVHCLSSHPIHVRHSVERSVTSNRLTTMVWSLPSLWSDDMIAEQ